MKYYKYYKKFTYLRGFHGSQNVHQQTKHIITYKSNFLQIQNSAQNGFHA